MAGRFDHPHLRAVFRTAPEPVAPRAVVIGVVGVAVPVLAGFLLDRVEAIGLSLARWVRRCCSIA